MTITKEKRGGAYKARIKTLDGKTKTLTTKAKTLPEAKRILKQSHLAEIEEAVKAGRLTHEALTQILAGKRVSCEEAVRQYLEARVRYGRSTIYLHNFKISVDQFIRQSKLEGRPITAVTEQHVYDFVNAPGQASAGWRRVKLSHLQRFFEFCSDRGWILGNPSGQVEIRMDLLTHEQKEVAPPSPFTDDEIETLLNTTEPGSFWHTAIALGRYAGLRLGDVCQIEWDCFSKLGKIAVWTAKRDKRCELDLTDELIQAVGAVPLVKMRNAEGKEIGESRYLFPVEREIYLDVRRRSNLSTYFRRICHRAGITGKTFHDLRAAFCLACDAAGVPIEHIARRVGHSSTETTRGYMRKD